MALVVAARAHAIVVAARAHAIVVAARAHAISARREWGDFRDGWPQSAGVPSSELPGRVGEDAASAPAVAPPVQGGRLSS